jgi:hypothetical protein
MGFVSVPLCRHAQRVSTPGDRSLHRTDGATRQFSFRPRGFTPPRRFAPHNGARVCCTPQPARGSPRFGPSCPRRRPRATAGGRGPSPRRGSHPSKSFPRQQPYRITAAVAFLPLPFTTRGWGWAEAALHARSRLAGAGRDTHRPGSRGRQRVGCGTGLRCGDAPIRRGGPPRHRCAAASARPKPEAGVAQNRSLACDAEATRCQARSNHRWGRA